MTNKQLERLNALKEQIDSTEKRINNNTGKIEQLKKNGNPVKACLSFYLGSEISVYLSKECILKEMNYNLNVDKLQLMQLLKTFENQ